MQRAQRTGTKGFNEFLSGDFVKPRRTVGGLDVESVTLDQRDAQMELTLQAVETTAGVSLSLQYNTTFSTAKPRRASFPRSASSFPSSRMRRTLRSMNTALNPRMQGLPKMTGSGAEPDHSTVVDGSFPRPKPRRTESRSRTPNAV